MTRPWFVDPFRENSAHVAYHRLHVLAFQHDGAEIVGVADLYYAAPVAGAYTACVQDQPNSTRG